MKTVRTAETFRINKINVLYMIMIDQTSESQLQLDDYYMNTAMKLAMNIITEYKSSLKEEESTWEKIQHLSDKSEWMKTFKDEIQRFIDYHMFELVEQSANKLIISTKYVALHHSSQHFG